MTCGDYDWELDAGFCNACKPGYDDDLEEGVCRPTCGDMIVTNVLEECEFDFNLDPWIDMQTGCQNCRIQKGY